MTRGRLSNWYLVDEIMLILVTSTAQDHRLQLAAGLAAIGGAIGYRQVLTLEVASATLAAVAARCEDTDRPGQATDAEALSSGVEA